MSIDSFDTLSAEVLDWLDRPDLAAKIPTMIGLAESTLARRLDLAENEVQVRLNLVAGRAPLPEDYGAWRAVNADRGRPLDYLTPEMFLASYGSGYGLTASGQGDGYDDVATGRGGRPWAFTIIGSIPLDDVDEDVSTWDGPLDRPFILTGPAATGQISFIYRQGIPPLTKDATSNWLLRAAPDLYLAATLAEFAPYLRDDSRLAIWEAKIAQKVDDLQTLDRARRWGRARTWTLEPTP